MGEIIKLMGNQRASVNMSTNNPLVSIKKNFGNSMGTLKRVRRACKHRIYRDMSGPGKALLITATSC